MCEDNTICRFFPFRFLNIVWCSTVPVMRVVLHTGESVMVLYASEMRDVMFDLPMTEDERMETVRWVIFQ